MSRLCAKPICSNPAVRWFDILVAQRRVVECDEVAPSAIPLCGAHADRFSAPAGWTIDSSPSTSQSPSANRPPVVAQAPIPESGREAGSRLASALKESTEDRPRRRKHDRDAPWFLAGSPSGPAPLDGAAAFVAPLLPASADVDDANSNQVVPSAGSLLHRAFHGPDRDNDVARIKNADRDLVVADSDDIDSITQVADIGDLTNRREKQTESEGYDIELPFPPFEPARRVAVS